MHRFFVRAESINGEVVKITGSDFNHISHSLRLNSGDKIIVSTGDGQDYTVQLTKFAEKEVEGQIIAREKNQHEPTLKVTLAQAIPKKNNMDLIVQKCTEIGINQIIPLETRRTIVQLKGKKEQKRIERWQRVAEEAAKQSQRGIIPKITEIMKLDNLAEIKDRYDLILIPWEGERSNNFKEIWHHNLNEQLEQVLIIIGPEGGFSEEEISLVREMGGIPCTLGPRILRTETAGLVALTMLLYEAGELGGE